MDETSLQRSPQANDFVHRAEGLVTTRPVRSPRSKLRMSPPRLISMSPSSNAWIVPLPKAVAGTTRTSRASEWAWCLRVCP